jgi:hypothetical protein
MGGAVSVVKKALGDDPVDEARKRASALAAERKKVEDETLRRAGEAAASSKRARRGGLMGTASVTGGEQTLGSGPNL